MTETTSTINEFEFYERYSGKVSAFSSKKSISYEIFQNSKNSLRGFLCFRNSHVFSTEKKKFYNMLYFLNVIKYDIKEQNWLEIP